MLLWAPVRMCAPVRRVKMCAPVSPAQPRPAPPTRGAGPKDGTSIPVVRYTRVHHSLRAQQLSYRVTRST